MHFELLNASEGAGSTNVVAMPDIAQSLPFCILLSALGGAIEVAATAVLAHREADERKTGKEWGKVAQLMALGCNVALQLVSSIIGNLFSTWYGPVSIVGPIFLSSQLLANMLVFGWLLGLESFNKDMRIGTYVVVTAVALLPIVGPTAQDSEDLQELLSTLPSVIWTCINVGSMFVGTACLLTIDIANLKQSYRMLLLLIVRATAFTVNLTVSKVFVLNVSTALLAASVLLKVISGAIITYALVIQSTAVPQAIFAPLNASALIFVNAVTGMLIWQDYLVVSSWVGYGCVFVQLVLGNYLLLGDEIDLLSPENRRFGRQEMLRRTGILRLKTRKNEEIQTVANSNYNMFEGEVDDLDCTGEVGDVSGRRARLSTTREAWSSVYFSQNDMNHSLHRPTNNIRRTIFAIDGTPSNSFPSSGMC